ncbi:MAG: exosortase/archaeosortase family protein [Akkermansiaceae bacterium]|jgi:exosortase
MNSETDTASEITLSRNGFSSMAPAVLFTGAAAWVIFLYMFTFYPAYPTTPGLSLAGWTWSACNSLNGFLHGRFVPFAFVVMAVIAWKNNRGEKLSPSMWGILSLSLGLLFYLVSIRTIQPRLALIGVPFVIIGLVHFSFGLRFAKAIIFPAFFFWFTIPVPGLEAALTGNLQTLITKLCYQTGMFFGMDLTRSGSTITIGGSDLEIAEGCSGIRSLMALVMIAAVYANYTQKELWKKAVLFASAMPLAIVGNFGRIFTILVLTQLGMEEFAKQTYHDWAGLLLFFPITLSGLYMVDYLLNLKTRRKKKVKRTIKAKSDPSKTPTADQ